MHPKALFLGSFVLMTLITATVGCGGGGSTYDLVLDYPNEAVEEIVEVEVYAMKSSEEATCAAMLGGTRPTEIGSPKIVIFNNPNPNPGEADLKGIGSGNWVFYARARNSEDYFLHGCTETKVGETDEIVITMNYL